MRQQAQATFPILPIMFLIFLTLKLTGVIAWSWWWVTAPLWMPLAVVIGIVAIGFVVVTAISLINELTKKRK